MQACLQGPDYTQGIIFTCQDQAFSDKNGDCRCIFQGELRHRENKMDQLGRRWSMGLPSLNMSPNLATKQTLAPALTVCLDKRKQAKFFLMYIKLSLSALTESL